MYKWLALYVALLSGAVAVGMSEPGQANTTKAALPSLTHTGKIADRLPIEATAPAVRTVRVVYPSHLASAK